MVVPLTGNLLTVVAVATICLSVDAFRVVTSPCYCSPVRGLQLAPVLVASPSSPTSRLPALQATPKRFYGISKPHHQKQHGHSLPSGASVIKCTLGLVGIVATMLKALTTWVSQLTVLVGVVVAAAVPRQAIVGVYVEASARVSAFLSARAEARKKAAANAEAAAKMRAWIHGADAFRQQHNDAQFRAWVHRSWESFPAKAV